MDGYVIQEWLAALDAISYYQLFDLPREAEPDAIRRAFHTFAEAFHPDMHRWRDPSDQASLGVIFRRGVEAYRVLADPALRARYDEALAQGILRPEELVVGSDGTRTPSTAPASSGGGNIVDRVRTPSARPFVARAVELAKKGDPRQAKLQLVMAMHRENENSALEAFARELDEAIKRKVEAERKSWQK